MTPYSERITQVKKIVADCESKLPDIITRIREENAQFPYDLQIDIAEFSVKLQSVLDYLTLALVVKYNIDIKHSKVYFPQTNSKHTWKNNDLYVKLNTANSKIGNKVSSYQYYKPNQNELEATNEWLNVFLDFCNNCKHQELNKSDKILTAKITDETVAIIIDHKLESMTIDGLLLTALLGVKKIVLELSEDA